MGQAYTAKYFGMESGTKAGDLAIGTSVYIPVSGTSTEFLVVHQGNPDSSLYDSSCDGTWLLMKDLYTTYSWNSTSGGINSWAYAPINTTCLNSSFYNYSLDGIIAASVIQVKIPYVGYAGDSQRIYSGANGNSCHVFLLSLPEVGYSFSTGGLIIGSKLDYFAADQSSTVDTGSEAAQLRVAKYNGSATNWWLRSIPSDDTTTAWSVLSYGAFSQRTITTSSTMFVRPCFILPSDFDITNYLTA